MNNPSILEEGILNYLLLKKSLFLNLIGMDTLAKEITVKTFLPPFSTLVDSYRKEFAPWE